MTTRREIVKAGAGLAAIIAAGKAPAAFVRSLVAGRNAMMAGDSKPTPAYWGLCFTAEEPGVVVNMVRNSTPSNVVTLETSFDGASWSYFDPNGGTTPVTLSNIGDRVYFRAGTGGNSSIAQNASRYRMFTFSKKCKASGNIMSILDGSNQNNLSITAPYCFSWLFRGASLLTSAPEFPATSLSSHCYNRMFFGCESLTKQPDLPAMSVPESAYSAMFMNCYNMVQALASLPAMVLGKGCYANMYQGTAIKKAPILPATNLAQNCYSAMFYKCANLTTVPELPAVTLQTASYNAMFKDCASLSDLTVQMTDFAGACTYWLENTSPTGTFRCPVALGTNETITRGTSACPVGWTVVNTD